VHSVKVYCGIKASRQVFIGIVKIDLNDFDSEINCHSLMSLSVSVMGGGGGGYVSKRIYFGGVALGERLALKPYF